MSLEIILGIAFSIVALIGGAGAFVLKEAREMARQETRALTSIVNHQEAELLEAKNDIIDLKKDLRAEIREIREMLMKISVKLGV